MINYKTLVQVLGQHVLPILKYLSKCFAQIYRAQHGAVMLVYLQGKLRPGSYLALLPCRMQFKQKIMKQIISLSIVLIAFDTAAMRRMNRA